MKHTKRKNEEMKKRRDDCFDHGTCAESDSFCHIYRKSPAMAESYFSREYVSMRVTFIVSIVLLTNIAWTIISFSNGYGLYDLLSQKGFMNKFLIGILEMATLVELPFFIVWKALTTRDRHNNHLYAAVVLLSIATAAFFSWAFCQFKEDSMERFLTNFSTDLVISFLATIVFTMIIHKNMVNELVNEKERILEEKARLSEANAIAQADAINMRIDNHFFFNSFSVLASLIQEDPGKAEEFLLEMTDMHRSIIKFSNTESIPVCEELKLLGTYMKMARYRFGDHCISLGISQDLNTHDDARIIPLSLLHLVENAIKHNSYSEESPLSIEIEVEKGKGGQEYITVTNNRQEKISKPASTRQGLENIRRKYSLVSGQVPVIEDNKDSFKVKLPIIEKWKY